MEVLAEQPGRMTNKFVVLEQRYQLLSLSYIFKTLGLRRRTTQAKDIPQLIDFFSHVGSCVMPQIDIVQCGLRSTE